VIVRYKGEHLMSGKVRSPDGDITPGGIVTYTVQDDWRWIVNTLGWVNPGNPIKPTSLAAATQSAMGQAWLPGGLATSGADGTIQGQSGYYLWPTEVRKTEAAVKALIQDNFDRLNRYYAQFPQLDGFRARNYRLGPNLKRGIDHVNAGGLPQVRMGTLDTYIVQMLTAGNLGLRFAQDLDEPIVDVDVYVPAQGPRLTVASGAVAAGSWSNTSPNATHATVGGPGDLAARMYDQVSTPRAGDTRTPFPSLDVIEVFKDAASGQIDWPETLSDAYRVEKYAPLRADVAATSYADALATIAEAAADALSDGAPSSGVSVTLSESKHFQYGGELGVHVGDWVTIATGDDRALEFTDQISECTLALTQDNGLVVTPVVGDKKLTPDQRFSRAIVRLARTLHRRSASQ
jgi:hypothetical protein